MLVERLLHRSSCALLIVLFCHYFLLFLLSLHNCGCKGTKNL
jgi:hypothetical protein